MAKQTCAVTILVALLCQILAWFQANYQASLRWCPGFTYCQTNVDNAMTAAEIIKWGTAAVAVEPQSISGSVFRSGRRNQFGYTYAYSGLFTLTWEQTLSSCNLLI